MLLALLYTFSFFAFNTKAMMPNDARLESTAALVKGADADFVFLTEEYTGQLRKMLEDSYPYAATARSHIDETERFYSKYPIVGVEDIGALPTERGQDVWVHKVLGREGGGRYAEHLLLPPAARYGAAQQHSESHR